MIGSRGARGILRGLILGALALLLFACGGGSHEYTPYMPPEPTVLRSDLLFGYYLTTSAQQALEQADHVNLVHESNYGGIDATIASMKAHGKPTMLGFIDQAYTNWPNYVARPDADIEANAARTFAALQAAGVLSQVVALYPMDEPEAQHLSDAAVTQVNGAIRRAAASFPELREVKLAVIYGTNRGFGANRGTPGIASYDWIGADDYDMGPGILVSPFWLELMNSLLPGQRVLLIPGGVSPWREDPEPFRRYAHNEPRVAGILAFLWHHPEPGHEATGIDVNGMTDTYRALGRGIVRSGLTTQSIVSPSSTDRLNTHDAL